MGREAPLIKLKMKDLQTGFRTATRIHFTINEKIPSQIRFNVFTVLGLL